MPEYIDLLLSFLTLTVLEVVLGIDNLVFLAVITQKLPANQQKHARKIGLTSAWVSRLIFLASAVWLMQLTDPLFRLYDIEFSGRDLFLLIGGLFLIVKATEEIHVELESKEIKEEIQLKKSTFGVVIAQIALLDVIFSLDSVLTAIGLTQNYWLMATAISIAILTMVFASEPLSAFIERHPPVKMLALSFLILIGMVLVADSLDFHIPRGYIYFAMGFAILVESLNLIRFKRTNKAR